MLKLSDVRINGWCDLIPSLFYGMHCMIISVIVPLWDKVMFILNEDC